MYDNNYLCLLSIYDSINKIIEYTKDFSSVEGFYNDLKSFDAVMMNFIIIGEQSFKLDEEFKMQNSEIEWYKIKAFRNIVAHDYFGVDASEVWGIIKKHIPELKKRIKELIHKIENCT